MATKKIKCLLCPGMMHPESKKGCRKCSHGSRPRHPDSDYAAELGISIRTLRRLGGAERLRAMSDEARTLVVKPWSNGNSRSIVTGGLKARGMFTRTPGRLTQSKPV